MKQLVNLFMLAILAVIFEIVLLLLLGPIFFGFAVVMPPYLLLNLGLALALVSLPTVLSWGYQPKPAKPVYLRWAVISLSATLAFSLTFYSQARALASVVYQHATTSPSSELGVDSSQAMKPDVPPSQAEAIKLALTWRYLSPPFLRSTCTLADEVTCPWYIQLDATYAQPIPFFGFNNDIELLPLADLIDQRQAMIDSEYAWLWAMGLVAAGVSGGLTWFYTRRLA